MSSSNDEKRGSEKTPQPSGKQGDSSKDANESLDGPSLASRIQNSASGLVRSAFYASSTSADTAHVLAGDSKAAPSSSASALAAAEKYRETSTPSSSSTRDQSTLHPAESFRSSSTAQNGGFELPPLTEDEFQRTSDEHHLNNTIDISGTTTQKSKGKNRETVTDLNSPVDSRFLSNNDAAWQRTSVPSDGDAVVSLLSDKTFDPEFPPSADEPFEAIATELVLPQLTLAEIEMIESFRRHMGSSETPTATQSQPRRLTSLSLVPDIDTFIDSIPPGSDTDATALRDAVLTSLPGAADWVAVEERYHDEVWGYLQPTLEAAAKEIESNKEQGTPTEDGPAVRRLKMILRHMQT